MLATILTTAISLFVGWWVSQYFYRRSINKSLGIYGLFNSFVFAGIAADVRKQLHFRFKDREVVELQQLAFLVANDGERAIREPLEPLSLPLPSNVELLDATIIHRSPAELKVEIRASPSEAACERLAFHFPLLNKGEFFVVKLLINGHLPIADSTFAIQADDLPRTLIVKPAPQTTDSKFRMDWGLAGLAAFLWVWLTWLVYLLFLVRETRADLFPYPWASFRVSIQAILFVIAGLLVLGLLALLALLSTGAALTGGNFSFPSRPRFPLPQALRESVFPFDVPVGMSLKPMALSDEPAPTKPPTEAALPVKRNGDTGKTGTTR